MVIFAVIGALSVGLVFALFCRWFAGDGLDRITRIFSLHMTNTIKYKTNNTNNKSNESNNATPILVSLKHYLKTVCKLFAKKYSNNDICTKDCGVTYKDTFNNTPDIVNPKPLHIRIIRRLKKCVNHKQTEPFY
jgi:hypothetical protein